MEVVGHRVPLLLSTVTVALILEEVGLYVVHVHYPMNFLSVRIVHFDPGVMVLRIWNWDSYEDDLHGH